MRTFSVCCKTMNMKHPHSAARFFAGTAALALTLSANVQAERKPEFNTLGLDMFTNMPLTLRKSDDLGLKPGLSECHLKVGGKELTFYVFAPKYYDTSKAYPVVFTFNGTMVGENSWMPCIGQMLEEYEYLCVNPQGQDRAEVDALFAWIKAQAKVDAARVYAMGSSRGGMFAIDLALTTDYFAAIAPVAAMLTAGRLKEDSPKIPVFQINGELDRTIPYKGGKGHGREFLGALESARVWAKHNGCNSEPEVDSSHGGLVLRRYPAGGHGPEIVQCTVLNTGHSVLRIMPDAEVSALTGMVWQFFARNVKK